MVSFELNDQKKVRAGLTTFGIIFSFLGLIFLFDERLLAVGNILSGLFLLIGLKSTMQFLVKPQNLKGTISFSAGFLFVVIGWPMLVMILEGSGFFMLFSSLTGIMIMANECLYNLETKKICTASKCRQAQFHL